ncbi:hypothetical protein [Sphingomonas sanxanigenens]|uniref:hypothetical protein n=1 Tax=Sphingomonas sanxanigenens TaxID=397260 RepID=UPI0004B36365|nr:hypothetical protein [Sphingomonas sanxanigenens]
MRSAAIMLAIVPLSLLAGEAILRVHGWATHAGRPLYHADNRIGYIPLPSQSGSAYGRLWVFNERSMGTASPFRPTARKDILLIGDSLVFGGQFTQADKLGPQLEAVSGGKVWPISAPSWALQNELQYLRDHPEVVQGVDEIIFLLNAKDFRWPSSWASKLSHPRVAEPQPRSLLWSAIRRKWYRIFGKPVDPAKVRTPYRRPRPPPGLKLTPRDNVADMGALVTAARKPIHLIFYPDQAELPGVDPCGFELPDVARLPGLTITCVKADKRWSRALYSDHIHPSAEGVRVLSRIIADSLGRGR